MKYTRESLAERCASCIEAKPTEKPVGSTMVKLRFSPLSLWLWDGVEWLLSCKPKALLSSLNFVVRCVEAAGMLWWRTTTPTVSMWQAITTANDHIGQYIGCCQYTDNNHALALALALAGALDGEPAEMEEA